MIKFSKKQIFLGITGLVIALGFIGSTGSQTPIQTQQKTSQTQEQTPTTQIQGVRDEVKIASPEPSPTPKPTPSPKLASPTPKTITSAPTYCLNGTYVNSVGNTVCRPEQAPSTPAGATAICRDGSYSFSQSRSGTCSHHGGVSRWL